MVVVGVLEQLVEVAKDMFNNIKQRLRSLFENIYNSTRDVYFDA